ncbi:hypothetical protein EN962_27215 [Mesorhizobium sp. M7A.F.Ca.CA.001.09.2.1]|nr:hypothetical protein EN962_27215 [Mesorhizobium sp. M7A.F.Ca.CA.001.09.2.1]RVA80959.1 hypothetical protein EN914_15220 [Mesorhizobium sp. M7A.F.Ca.CA.001.08.2.1]
MGKKPKQHTESTADREKAIEATYFAHNCGLSKDEAVKMLREDPIRIDDESQESSGRRTEAILDCSSQPAAAHDLLHLRLHFNDTRILRLEAAPLFFVGRA